MTQFAGELHSKTRGCGQRSKHEARSAVVDNGQDQDRSQVVIVTSRSR
jgi:hypothetical protein